MSREYDLLVETEEIIVKFDRHNADEWGTISDFKFFSVC